MHASKVAQGGAAWLQISAAGSTAPQHYVLGDLVADAGGRHTHTVMQTSTPGVLHLAVFSHDARQVRSHAPQRSAKQLLALHDSR